MDTSKSNTTPTNAIKRAASPNGDRQLKAVESQFKRVRVQALILTGLLLYTAKLGDIATWTVAFVTLLLFFA